MKKFILLPLIAVLFFSCKKDKDSPRTKIVYQTDFSKDDEQWYLDDNGSDSLSAVIEDGTYHIKNNFKLKWQYFYTNPVFSNDTGNTAVETKFSLTAINSNPDAYCGIIWGENASNNQVFIFGCYTDGYYDIWGYPGGQDYKEFKEATESSALHKNGSNILRIELKGGTLHFLINGKEVYSMPSSVSSLDNSGVSVDAESEAKYDYFKAEMIP